MKKVPAKKSKKGFTLIELVVVIAILGILAAILVPVISGFIDTANLAADNANGRLVYQSAAMWYASNNPTDASTPLSYDDVKTYIDASATAFPVIKSKTLSAGAGGWSLAVASDGTITLSYNAHPYVATEAKFTP
ncbi:MAG: type II secretion system GspH family protein [Clostridiales bacterium]|nr:type II secretion system GspH family protein [Clostridiales bacterium]